MGRFIVIVTLSLSSMFCLCSQDAYADGVHICLGPIGVNFAHLRSDYESKFGNGGQASFALGLIRKGVIYDLGFSLWTVRYRNEIDISDGGGRFQQLVDSAEVSSFSIMISAGRAYTTKSFIFSGKAIFAPTLLTEHKINIPATIGQTGAPVLKPNTEGFYIACGLEVGVGVAVNPHFFIGLKYTLMPYLSTLKYDKMEVTGFNLNAAPTGERPMLHSLGFSMDLYIRRPEEKGWIRNR